MRELVYVSTAKLRQFQSGKPTGQLANRLRRLTAKAPLGFGELEVEVGDKPADQVAALSEVVRHLDNNRKIYWFADPSLQPGSWIQFETQLNFDGHFDTTTPILGGPVVFWNTVRDVDEQGSRLILHGSSKHMISEVQPANVVHHVPYSGPSFLEWLSDMNLQSSVRENVGKDPWAPSGPDEEMDQDFRNLLWTLDGRRPATTASWMAGYARVTTYIPEWPHWRTVLSQAEADSGELYRQHIRSLRRPIVVASPLFVQRIDGPSSGG